MAMLCLFSDAARAGVTVSGGCDLKFINQQTNPSYRETFEKQVKDKLGDKAITWTSCYRDKAQQLAICREKCPGHADSCPGTCAPAGQSNHQKVSTADVGGIPGDVKAGCEFLYGVCQAMRAQDQNLACEIGGYGPGGHHLAVGKGIKNTAYNQCAYLKPKMGATPSNTDGLKKEGDDLMNSIMKAAPAAAQAAQAMNQGGQGSGGDQGASPSSTTGAGATSPTPDSNGSGASSRNDGSGSGSGSGKGNGDGVTTGRFIATLPDGKPGAGKDGAGGGGGGGANPSDITHANASRIGSGGTSSPGGAAPGPNGTGASSGGSGGSGGASRGGSPGGGDKAQDPANSPDAELLASFAGGNKFNGGGGGKGSSSSGMPDGDSVVKNAITEASQQNENPAPQAADGIGAEEGETIFARVHAAYTRCALGGTITNK